MCGLGLTSKGQLKEGECDVSATAVSCMSERDVKQNFRKCNKPNSRISSRSASRRNCASNASVLHKCPRHLIAPAIRSPFAPSTMSLVLFECLLE